VAKKCEEETRADVEGSRSKYKKLQTNYKKSAACHNARSVMGLEASALYRRHCPARDMLLLIGGKTKASPGGVDKKECIRRCRLAGYRFAGRQGDNTNGGAHQCFCADDYGGLGSWDGISARKAPNGLTAFFMKGKEQGNATDDGFITDFGKGSGFAKVFGEGQKALAWQSDADSLKNYLKHTAKIGWTKDYEPFPANAGNIFCEQATGVETVNVNGKILPKTPLTPNINCIYKTSDGTFMGAEEDVEIDRIIIESRWKDDWDVTFKSRLTEPNGMDAAVPGSGKWMSKTQKYDAQKAKKVCRMAVDMYVGLCRGCCCARGAVQERVNTQLILDQDPATNFPAGGTFNCRSWFKLQDSFIRAAITLTKVMRLLAFNDAYACSATWKPAMGDPRSKTSFKVAGPYAAQYKKGLW